MEEEQVVCPNCKREVPASNMVIHAVRCARSTTCDTCNDTVPGEKLEEHQAMHEKLEKCDHCQKEVKEAELQEHMESCEERMVSCEYCEIDLRKSEMDEHMAYCGTRTEKCEECDQLVMFKDKKRHLESNHGAAKPDNEGLKNGDDQEGEYEQCPDCKERIPLAEIQNHLLSCDQQLLNCAYCEREITKGQLEAHEKYCGTRTERCPECDELVMLKYKDLHLESNHTFLKLDDEPGPLPLSKQTKTAYKTESFETGFKPWAKGSTVCRKEIAKRENRPQTKCPSKHKKDTFDNFDDPFSNFMPRAVTNDIQQITNLFSSDFPSYPNKKKSSKTPELGALFANPLETFLVSSEDDNSPPAATSRHGHRLKRRAPLPPPAADLIPFVNDEVLLPCEMCEKLFNPAILMRHQENCPKRYSAIKRNDAKLNANILPMKEVEKIDEIELPCEFCFQMFPASRLISHQNACNQI